MVSISYGAYNPGSLFGLGDSVGIRTVHPVSGVKNVTHNGQDYPNQRGQLRI